VLKSAILHFEIEVIHPFADGNGRMGRLWQTLMLSKWISIFAWIPMASVIHENRPEYSHRWRQGQLSGDSSRFIEFTLASLLSSLQNIYEEAMTDKHQVKLTEKQLAVLKALDEKPFSRKELFAVFGMSGDSRAFKRHIEPLIAQGLIEMTIPDKPNSRNQKYVRT